MGLAASKGLVLNRLIRMTVIGEREQRVLVADHTGVFDAVGAVKLRRPPFLLTP
jgi:hypothetical protein